ncbi:MAG: guanylate kinase, partial [Kiritimatiellia bacterium]
MRLIRPLLLVISAPSGAGKSTLCARLRVDFPGMAYSVSCTTRTPRGEERDGREYHFLTPEAFERKLQAGEFLEWAAVHDRRYGTLRAPLEAELRAGRDVLMDIDVQGAARIRAAARREDTAGLL